MIATNLSVRENSGDMKASGALDIHEETVGRLNQSLQLVLGLLVGLRGVEQILGHIICKMGSIQSIRTGVTEIPD